MQRICLMVLVSVFCAITVQAQETVNLLVNSSFEAPGPDGESDVQAWSLPKDPKDCILRSTEAARTGKASLKSVDDGSRSGVFPNASQTVILPADAPGRQCKLSAWAMTPEANGLADGLAMLKIEFLDAKRAGLGKPIEKNFLGKTAKRSEWIYADSVATIPPEARFVKIQLMHNWGAKDAGGTMYFDDATFEIVK